MVDRQTKGRMGKCFSGRGCTYIEGDVVGLALVPDSYGMLLLAGAEAYKAEEKEDSTAEKHSDCSRVGCMCRNDRREKKKIDASDAEPVTYKHLGCLPRPRSVPNASDTCPTGLV